MGKNIKVSVIIPVYNSKKYIRETLDCISNQTLENFEIICIDDASSDDSCEILREIEKDEPRLRVIRNKENMGAALSRNRGLEIAKGDYVIFLDADDIFADRLLEKAYSAIIEHKADIVWLQYDILKDGKIFTEYKYIQQFFCECILQKDTFSPEEIPDYIFNILNEPAWNKLYRREFLQESEIKFQNLKNSNDVYFSEISYVLAKKIHILFSEALIHYRYGAENCINSTRKNNYNCFLYALKNIQEELLSRGLYTKYKKSFLNFSLKHIYIWSRKWDDVACNIVKKAEELGLKKEILNEKECQYYDLYMYSCVKKILENPVNIEETARYPIGSKEYFNEYYQINSTKIMLLIDYLAKLNCRTGLWGLGNAAEVFYEICKKRRYDIAYFIDRSDEKQKNGWMQEKVFSFQEVKDDVELLIFLNGNIVDEVIHTIKTEAPYCEVFNVDLFLQFGLNVEDLIKVNSERGEKNV